MEKLVLNFNLTGERNHGKKVVCGVVSSGNLEVIIEENQSVETLFNLQTPIEGYCLVWTKVIENFVAEYKPIGLQFTLNDNGATPPVVALRLRQAFELFQGYQQPMDNYLELDARQRIKALFDKNSFTEWLGDEKLYSPHLAMLDLPGEADDGIVIGLAHLNKKKVLIAAQQKDFMGGSVGEIHGAKLTGLFKAALKKDVAAVILLIDSGGVRLHEANAGEIAISEMIRAIFAVRNQGIMTIGVVCGKNGAFGGMGIVSACLDYAIINETGRIGVSGPEVIQAVKGIDAFDSQDRALIWRVYGGKTRYLQQIAQTYTNSTCTDIKNALISALDKRRSIELPQLKSTQQLLKNRLNSTLGCDEEGTYLQKNYPNLCYNLFELNQEAFLKVADEIAKQNGALK